MAELALENQRKSYNAKKKNVQARIFLRYNTFMYEIKTPRTTITNTHQALIYYIAHHCEWDEWIIGACSSSCGGGMRNNTRSKKASAEHEGNECDGVTSIMESCNVQECPGYKLFNAFVLPNLIQ